MDAKVYVSALQDIQKSATLLMCEYCGIETSSLGDTCICSNCESMVVTNRAILEKKDHVLLDALDNINRSMSDSNYDQAIQLYDKLILERKEPSLMYAEAIAYLKYSNHEITNIGYMRAGFMEENTLHRDKAAKLVSLSKRLLTKSVSLANAEIAKGNKPLNLIYNKFLAQIKMGSVKGSKESVEMLKGMGNEYIYNYAQLVFAARMEKYDNTLRAAEKLTKKDSFSINAFYYIGLALFKKGKFKDAKSVLESVNGIIKSANLDTLIFEVDAQLR